MNQTEQPDTIATLLLSIFVVVTLLMTLHFGYQAIEKIAIAQTNEQLYQTLPIKPNDP